MSDEFLHFGVLNVWCCKVRCFCNMFCKICLFARLANAVLGYLLIVRMTVMYGKHGNDGVFCTNYTNNVRKAWICTDGFVATIIQNLFDVEWGCKYYDE